MRSPPIWRHSKVTSDRSKGGKANPFRRAIELTDEAWDTEAPAVTTVRSGSQYFYQESAGIRNSGFSLDRAPQLGSTGQFSELHPAIPLHSAPRPDAVANGLGIGQHRIQNIP